MSEESDPREPAASRKSVTLLLEQWATGDPSAFEEVVPMVYDELRSIAARQLRRERRDHTLQATALVNEAYLRLTDKERSTVKTRSQFFAVAAQAMRRVLVDHARRNMAAKRIGPKNRIALEDASPLAVPTNETLVHLDDLLKRLQEISPRQARIVELRYFGGLTGDEVADVLEISAATVAREWRIAKLWLRRKLSGEAEHDP